MSLPTCVLAYNKISPGYGSGQAIGKEKVAKLGLRQESEPPCALSKGPEVKIRWIHFGNRVRLSGPERLSRGQIIMALFQLGRRKRQ